MSGNFWVGAISGVLLVVGVMLVLTLPKSPSVWEHLGGCVRESYSLIVCDENRRLFIRETEHPSMQEIKETLCPVGWGFAWAGREGRCLPPVETPTEKRAITDVWEVKL